MMRVAALYDIHGNLPALEAVLQDVRQANVDQIVVGGDVLPGPMPCETLTRLLDLDVPTQFIHGNGELAILAQMEGERTGSVTYWGTTTGARPPESIIDIFRWSAAQLPEFESRLTRWPKTVQFEIDGLGQVLFCHSTPRSETECFLKTTAEDRLLPLFEPLGVSVIVCGHTHMQFDRMVGSTRVVNAGSVGMPFAEPGAYWLLLGRDIQLRRTSYDLPQAAQLVRGTEYPDREQFAVQGILTPPSEEKMLQVFTPYELTP
jgi:predicted phosphodiesterase